MDFAKQCYEDTLKMAEMFRAKGMESEAAQYDKQAEMWKEKIASK